MILQGTFHSKTRIDISLRTASTALRIMVGRWETTTSVLMTRAFAIPFKGKRQLDAQC